MMLTWQPASTHVLFTLRGYIGPGDLYVAVGLSHDDRMVSVHCDTDTRTHKHTDRMTCLLYTSDAADDKVSVDLSVLIAGPSFCCSFLVVVIVVVVVVVVVVVLFLFSPTPILLQIF